MTGERRIRARIRRALYTATGSLLLLAGAGSAFGPVQSTAEEIIAFAEPAQCQSVQAFDDLLRRIIVFNSEGSSARPGDPILFSGLGERRPAIEIVTARSVVGRLPVGAEWHGLELMAIETDGGFESGPSNFSLIFADPPDKVARVLDGLGFALPPLGGRRLTASEVVESGIAFERRGAETVVTCFSD